MSESPRSVAHVMDARNEAPRAAEEKRRRILLAAREVCARSGYDGARMDEIAAVARVSKGTLYNFFDSKEDLFLSTVLDFHVESEQLIGELAHAGTPAEERLARWLRSMVDNLQTVSDGMTVNFQVWGVIARDDSARLRMFSALREIYAERRAVLRDILRAGAREGALRADLDLEIFVESVFGLFDGFVYRSTFEPAHANPESLRACFEALQRDARVGSRAGAGDTGRG